MITGVSAILIERDLLKAEVERLSRAARFAEDGVTALSERVENMQILLGRAADALEAIARIGGGENHPIVAELRKAAE